MPDPHIRVEPFSARIREATRADHERTELSPFITAFLDGRVSREGYAAMTGQLWFIYEALEAGAAALSDDPVASPFLDRRLFRRAALDADLTELAGADWRTRLTATSATRAHADRIVTLAQTWPGGYLAHHYTRYMGDLSGGKVVGKTAQRVYGLTDVGVRFYRFDDIPSGRAFKDGYRQLLNDAPWTEDERLRILDEACESFRMTGAMFDALEHGGSGIVRS
ncbi:MAG: biliverdin-producing heme oxygenase [Chloroflexi bacterium]|nr:biliverdin-producing heme oxygenase [Chloroflexota bacterium]